MRFDVLHVIREYTLGLFEASLENREVRDRHARYYVTLAEAASTGGGGDNALRREHQNFGSALDWLLDKGASGDGEAAELGLRLTNALGQFWYRHSLLEEGMTLLERALAVAADADELQRAAALRHLGVHLESRRDVDAARATFEEALDIYRRRGDRSGQAACMNSLGVVARTAGDLTEAEACFVESLALRRQLDDVAAGGNAMSNLAIVLMDHAEIARALELLHECEELDRAAGDHWALACTRNNLGVAHLLDGHPEMAEPLVADALRTFVEFGDDDGVAESLEALAGVAAARDDALRVLRLASAADAVRERAGVPPVGIDRRRLERWVTQAGAVLTVDAAAQAQNQGQQMTTDQAVRYALEQSITALT